MMYPVNMQIPESAAFALANDAAEFKQLSKAGYVTLGAGPLAEGSSAPSIIAGSSAADPAPSVELVAKAEAVAETPKEPEPPAKAAQKRMKK